ncbi:unnamed protein product [Pleuronectes platessa]|uniref:Uncharacterized protein n=1 Tax=Pleuronectes platessa TaxID=8262 RepID=A0A9N7UP82_PLEPL|nr:unnamed protein product [Pleuronectes platessa]
MSRLRKFANTGSWPAGEGNRPAPRQKKWYQLYQMIEKCPKMGHSHQSLFGHVRHCTCGFHTQKPTTASTTQGPTGQQAVAVAPVLPGTVERQAVAVAPTLPGTVVQQAVAVAPVLPGTVVQQAVAVAPVLPGTVGQKQSTAGSAVPKQRPLLNLSMVFRD